MEFYEFARKYQKQLLSEQAQNPPCKTRIISIKYSRKSGFMDINKQNRERL
jgi:hypothetical protein